MFDKYFKKHYDTFYVLFRIIIGLLFFVRGAGKLFGWFIVAKQGMPAPIGQAMFGSGMTIAWLGGLNLMWVAGVIETVGGLMIAFGLFSRLVAFIAAGEMIFAYILGHVSRGMGALPYQNGGEAALLYLAAFLVIIVHGSKKFSVERALCKGKECF